MGDGFMEGSLHEFFISDFVLKIQKRLKKLLKIFHFSDQWKEVSVAPQRGCTILLNSEVLFQTFWPRQVGLTLYMDF